MIKKKVRIGTDPLSWIRDTAKVPEAELPEEEGVLGTIPKVPEAPEELISESREGESEREPSHRKSSGGRRNLGGSSNSDNLDSLGSSGVPRRVGTHQKEASPPQANNLEGWTRSTVIARIEHLEKMKALAYFDRKQIKDVFDEAFSAYLKKRAADMNEAESLYKRR